MPENLCKQSAYWKFPHQEISLKKCILRGETFRI